MASKSGNSAKNGHGHHHHHGTNRAKNIVSKNGKKLHPEPWRNIKTRKQMIKEIAENQMTQLVHEADCLEANRKFSATYTGGSGSPNGARGLNGMSLSAKQKSAWTKVRTIGKIVDATRNNQKERGNLEEPDLENLDRDSQAKIRYLGLISQLLSALYNMKKNSVKSAECLSEIEVKELLNSDIEIDAEGRPKPKTVTKPTRTNLPFDSRKTSIANLLAGNSRGSKLGKMGINKKFKDLIKTSKIMKEQGKVATWDDLLYVDVSTGQILPPSSPLRGVRDRETSSFIPNETIYDNVINKYNIKSSKPIWLRSSPSKYCLSRSKP